MNILIYWIKTFYYWASWADMAIIILLSAILILSIRLSKFNKKNSIDYRTSWQTGSDETPLPLIILFFPFWLASLAGKTPREELISKIGLQEVIKIESENNRIMKHQLKEKNKLFVLGVTTFFFFIVSLLDHGSDIGFFKSRQAERTKKIALLMSSDTPSNIRDLKEKISNLTELKNKLTTKQAEVTLTKERYIQDIQQWKKEVLEETQRSSPLNSYSEVVKNKRINSNLALIQRQLAYLEKLNEFEFRLNMGTEEMRYLELEAQTDLTMSKVLDGNDELSRRIGKAIDDYSPYAENYVIDKSQLKLKSAEHIFDDIMSGKL